MYLNILKLDNIPFNQQTTAIFNGFIDTEYHLITTTLSAIYTHMVTMFIREITLNTLELLVWRQLCFLDGCYTITSVPSSGNCSQISYAVISPGKRNAAEGNYLPLVDNKEANTQKMAGDAVLFC